jgi:acetylornithine deacetylase/succinyl-diaminopimelate desuccinylase-like protein
MIAEYFEANKDAILDDFFTFLKFESVSSEPDHEPQVIACCQWLTDALEQIGMTVEIWESEHGHPCIYAENLDAGTDKPTLLLYNHYDVQPVDPLELWETPPFEPTIRDGEIYARGAQDNKGQCFYTLQALKFVMERDGKLPINIKWIIEGEEECGSDNLAHFLTQKKEQLKSDYLAIVDMGLHDLDEPTVNIGVRGIVTFDVELTGSTTDMHSGSWGGIAYNPNRALTEVLAGLYDADGAVTVPGFYDEVKPLGDDTREMISTDFDNKAFKKMFGAEPIGGEKQFSPFERAWIRPTLEINGIAGGYAGEGFKTVIPAIAKAKLSCRLVPDQDPDLIGKRVIKHIESLTPKGITCKASYHGLGQAVRSNPNSPVVKAFAEAYTETFQKSCGYTLDGGSIPIATALNDAAGSEIVLLGLGLPGDCIHAPNEHFGINRLKLGMQIMINTMEILSKEHAT